MRASFLLLIYSLIVILVAPVLLVFWVLGLREPLMAIGRLAMRVEQRVRPDLKDRIMILNAVPNAVEDLRKKFPDRPFFRIGNINKPLFFELAPIVP